MTGCYRGERWELSRAMRETDQSGLRPERRGAGIVAIIYR
jgi:hypothetical protein